MSVEELAEACESGKIEEVKRLQVGRVSIYEGYTGWGGDGKNALHTACWFGHVEIVEYLLEVSKTDNKLKEYLNSRDRVCFCLNLY